MPALIKTSIITYVITVPEEDVRAALAIEAAQKHGLVHDGKLIPGVTVKIMYDGRRGKSGSYVVTLVRDPDSSGQALLPGQALS